MKIIDLYKGYEGESEIIVSEEAGNNITFEIHLFDHYFNEVLALIPLGRYHQDSVMSKYFACNGWHDENWECIRIQEFYDQLNQIDITSTSKYIDIYNSLIEICESAINNRNKLFIRME